MGLPEKAAAARASDRQLIRIVSCGSVDDGKSTLLGRLLYDTGNVPTDAIEALRRSGPADADSNGEFDLAHLLDGLIAEREQGITIDVSYRYFETARRKFIIADAPGHEQYTRNMATGASTADAAIILVDASAGVKLQTRRHAFIVSLLGVRNIIVAVNKMDLVSYGRETFRAIEREFADICGALDFGSITCIPVSACSGENVVTRAATMDWYEGPTLLEAIERLEATGAGDVGVRFQVQGINKSNDGTRFAAGLLVSGRIRVGSRLMSTPAKRGAHVARIVCSGREVQEARTGSAPAIAFVEDVDVARGDLLFGAGRAPRRGALLQASLVWFDEQSLRSAALYHLKIGTMVVTAQVRRIAHRFDPERWTYAAADDLELNDIGSCEIETFPPIMFDAFAECRQTGSFILIDAASRRTVAAGMIERALARSSNVHWQALDVTRQAREALMGQKAIALWFTGLSGAGKSTIANLLERRLHAWGRKTYILDGDNIRHGLNADLGFTNAARSENLRRIAEVAKLMMDAGVVTIVSTISPLREQRRLARKTIEPGKFVEIFVDCPIDVCAARDPKGLYRRAAEGALRSMTGLDSPYERPERPEIVLNSAARDPEQMVETIVDWLVDHGLVHRI